MMRLARILTATGILALLTLSAHANPPTYPCFRADAPPVIDGSADDACWDETPLATGFSKLGDGYTDAKQTYLRICWDSDALYLLVVCEEPDADALKVDVRDGGPIWFYDGVEVFLQSGGQTYQFLVSAAGARTTGAGHADFRQFSAGSSIGETSYTLEIAIPHELMDAAPTVGDTWRGNVCRNIWTTLSGGDKFTCWAPLQRQFLEPSNFALLELRGEAPSTEALSEITRRLNSGYRAYLLGRLSGFVEQAPEYLPVLEQARESEELGSDARGLLYQWYRLERMQDASDRFTIGELREMVGNAEGLLTESYRVKYAWLIDQLFPD